MNTKTDKKSLKKALELPDVKFYHAPVDSGERLKEFSYFDTVMANTALSHWMEGVKAEKSDHDIEPSDELNAAFAEARQFVEELTGYDLSGVPLARSLAKENITAHYSYVESVVRFFADKENYSHVSGDLRHKALVSMCVHELMHATGANSTKIFGVKTGIGIDPYPISGYEIFDARIQTTAESGERKIGGTVGLFIEEAIAEEAAAIWREYDEPHKLEYGNEPCHISADPNIPALPYRYVDIEGHTYEEFPASSYSVGSAYCSEGMRQVGAYAEVDMFGLMLDLRDPEKAVSARRGIVQAIEHVEKGLYPKLRDLEYSMDDFISGYQMIMDAIARSPKKKRKIGAAVLSA